MKKVVCVVFALLLLFLCACGSSAVPRITKEPAKPSGSPSQLPSPSSDTSQSSQSSKPTPDVLIRPAASPSPSAKPTPSPSVKPSPSPSPSAKPSVSPSSNEKTPLPASSLAYMADYFAKPENNGFLLSSYSKPSEIDLHQLFYTGAGMATWDISPQEVDAYKAYYKTDELWGDLMKLTTKQVNDYLKEKMGITLADVKGNMKWLYLKQFDAYYVQRSDTNYGLFDCVSGYKLADGTVVVQCQVKAGYGQQVDKCEVTLKKVGDKFLFVSNKAHMTY